MCQSFEHGTVYMKGLNRVLNMSNYGQYASKMPEYVAIFLNILQYA